MSKSNVVNFPGPVGGNRQSPTPTRNEMTHDFMVMANYLTAWSDLTPWPKWTSCVAAELRKLARDMDER